MASTKIREVSTMPSIDCESLASVTSVSTAGRSVRFKALKNEVELLKQQVKFLLEISKLNVSTVKMQEMDKVQEDDTTLAQTSSAQDFGAVKEDDTMAKKAAEKEFDMVKQDIDAVKHDIDMVKQDMDTVKEDDVIAKDDFHPAEDVDQVKPVAATKTPSTKKQGRVAKGYLEHLTQTVEKKKKKKETSLEDSAKENEVSAQTLTEETPVQPAPTGKVDDNDDIIEEIKSTAPKEEEKSVVLSGIHNQSKPGTWKVVDHHPEKEEISNVNMSLMCGTGGGVGGPVKVSGSEKKPLGIRKMVSRFFRSAKSVIKVNSNSSSINKSKDIGKDSKSIETTPTGSPTAANPAESVRIDCVEMSDNKEKEGSKDASYVNEEDKCSSEVKEAVAEGKSAVDNDDEKKAEGKEKSECSAGDSENQADSEKACLTEVSTKPELGASAAPENNEKQDGKTVISRRSILSFRSNTSQDEDSVRSNRSKPRHGTVSQLKEKFNKLARNPSIDRVSSGFSNIKPKIRVPVKVLDNVPLEETQRDDTETTMMDEQEAQIDLSRADSMKRTSTFKSFTTASPYYTEKRSEPLSFHDEELQVETVISRCLNDDEDNCEIEMETISTVPRCWRSAVSMTGPEVISRPVKRVVSY
jgi:hypothetical protein